MSGLSQKRIVKRIEIDPFSDEYHQKQILTQTIENSKTKKIILYLHYIKPFNKNYKHIAKVIISKKSKMTIVEYVDSHILFDVLANLNFYSEIYRNYGGLEYYLMKKIKS
ncbi:MAG: hypothetical protein QXI09_03565 [Candidatus Aenigmatarchaeota archaeon]